MKLIKALILLSLLSLSACETPYQNLHTFDINHDNCKAFVIIEQNWQDTLAFVNAENQLTLIKTELDTLGKLANIIPSPTGQNIIIVSHGEGHPYLSLYNVNTLIENHDQAKTKAITSLDPYPYGFSNIKWLDEQHIQLTSAIDFSAFDSELRRGKSDLEQETGEQEKTWRWNIESDTFNLIAI